MEAEEELVLVRAENPNQTHPTNQTFLSGQPGFEGSKLVSRFLNAKVQVGMCWLDFLIGLELNETRDCQEGMELVNCNHYVTATNLPFRPETNWFP